MKVNESGRSMIEMLGVLAIIGVLSVGGIAGYSKAMSKYRVNKTVDQISHIAANTRILFSSQKNYSDLGINNGDVIDKAKLVPQEMGSDGNYSNPFSGDVTIQPAARFASNDDKAFMLTYEGIPEEACVDLATLDWGTGSGGGLVALSVNNPAIEDMVVDGSSGTKATPPDEDGKGGAAATETGCKRGNGIVCGGTDIMRVAEAVDACGSVNSNTLYFKFY